MRVWLLLVAAAACGSRRPDPIAWSTPIELASGGGTRGPWQQNDSHYDYVDDPSVALAPNGDAVVAWVDHRAKDVFWQIVDANGRPRLVDALNLSRSGTVFSWLPRVAVDPVDPAHI